jgi:hypothetical protein
LFKWYYGEKIRKLYHAVSKAYQLGIDLDVAGFGLLQVYGEFQLSGIFIKLNYNTAARGLP